MNPVIALVTARAARDLDEDLPPLEVALGATGAEVHVADWDDPEVNWASSATLKGHPVCSNSS